MAFPHFLPLAVTMGDPAGIGGELTLQAWMAKDTSRLPEFFVLDDPERLQRLAASLSWSVPIQAIDTPAAAPQTFAKALPVLPLGQPVDAALGKPDPIHSSAVRQAIETAVSLCQQGTAAAVVTNPISKDVMYRGGFSFPGHTEFLAELGQVPRTVMMLVGGGLRAVPVTVHQALRDAIRDLSGDAITAVCRITAQALKRDFGIDQPRLAVSGLNPHAGEAGALGREELDIIEPALRQLRQEGHRVIGPLPADTMFHAEARAEYDVAICMTHDQALIPVKTLDFHGGVNVTLGLPFIRTSPDHGTAFALAGTGSARPDSLIAAMRLARTMADRRTTR